MCLWESGGPADCNIWFSTLTMWWWWWWWWWWWLLCWLFLLCCCWSEAPDGQLVSSLLASQQSVIARPDYNFQSSSTHHHYHYHYHWLSYHSYILATLRRFNEKLNIAAVRASPVMFGLMKMRSEECGCSNCSARLLIRLKNILTAV